MSNLKKFIEILNCGKHLEENDLRLVLKSARECFVKLPNIVQVQSPVVVVGNIQEMMEIVGNVPDLNYLFLGDYVNTGRRSVLVFSLLICLKLLYPCRVTMLRGHHESRSSTTIGKFYNECHQKYNTEIWKEFNSVFDCLPLSACVNEEILCVHGGLSPSAITLDHILQLNRIGGVPTEGAICDILYSTPFEGLKGWGVSTHGVGYTFGNDVSKKFMWINNLELIIRSHSVVMEGFQYYHERRVVSIFSAPNYIYRYGNKAAVMMIRRDLKCKIIQYTHSPKSKKDENDLEKRPVPRVIITGNIL